MTRISELQRRTLSGGSGRHPRRIFDLRTAHERDSQRPRITFFLTGRGGLFRRLGIRRGSVRKVPFEPGLLASPEEDADRREPKRS